MKDVSGYCDKCRLWFATSPSYDERIHFSVCPECNGNLKRTDGSLAKIAKEIGLRPREISDKIAGIRRHGERHG